MTLGSRILRTLVQDASYDNQFQSLDVGGIVWLEHINLVVTSMQSASQFYVNFLGMTPEKEFNTKSNHFNLGQQQFHIATANNGDGGDEVIAQRVMGSIGLTVPSLERIRERLDLAMKELNGTLFSVIDINDDDDTNFMTVTCPYGNIIHLYDISIDNEPYYCLDGSNIEKSPLSSSVSSSPQQQQQQQKMVVYHSSGGIYGPHRMAVRGQPGIRYIEFACQRGTIDSIAKFYKTLLGCHVVRSQRRISSPINNNSKVVDVDVATVCVGPGVHLTFVENNNVLSATTTDDDNDTSISTQQIMDGIHICVYIPNFQSMYNSLQERKIIWTNPRFTHLDSCTSWEESWVSCTFRFKDIVDIDTGMKVFELEHEVRPLAHGQYTMKVPPYLPR